MRYRRDAAHPVIDTGRTIAEVAREIGIGEQLLGRWVATSRAKMDDPPGVLDVDERAGLEQLRAEVTDEFQGLPFILGGCLPPHPYFHARD